MAEQKASRELALKEKVHLIRFLETNSQRKTAERFHVSKTTVSNIQRRKREYLERYGVDFEDFVAIDDEVATSTEPDPQAVYQSILAEAGMSVEASSAGDDAEEESDDETEMVQKLKGEDVGRMLA
ncbi:hypothetical protein M514_26348 [Trichuris suis]|uniref:HTH psq-type domain-containing protein n=1 Tax=Trichuris suis TaxID=68888 RepID=A0A085MW56_9BILA|nr:hypothetical protein M514_26348 [Trichuris suis]